MSNKILENEILKLLEDLKDKWNKEKIDLYIKHLNEIIEQNDNAIKINHELSDAYLNSLIRTDKLVEQINQYKYELISSQEMYAKYLQGNHGYVELSKAIMYAESRDVMYAYQANGSDGWVARTHDGEFVDLVKWYKEETEVSK